MRTDITGIYAVGDVKGEPALTHGSYDDFRVLKANLLNGSGATIDGRLLPYAVFTDPELGRVGLSESEACHQRRDVLVFKMPMHSIARVVELEEARGFLKPVVDTATDRILGCAVPGIEGGELMSMLQMAMAAEVPFTRVRDMIFAHPTLAEGLNTLFDED